VGRVKKKKRGKTVAALHIVRPTEEREGMNAFRSAGMARKLVPEIDRLHEQGHLTDHEHRALHHYRDQASLADRSPTRSCLDFSPKGGHGPGVAITSALLETGRIERELGQLWKLARAVAVDDMSLTQWCIGRYGAREKLRDGKVVALAPLGPNRAVEMARLELRMAAHRIVK
jgi:hypothetical protein